MNPSVRRVYLMLLRDSLRVCRQREYENCIIITFISPNPWDILHEVILDSTV
ncbi:hypothetical protein LCGC14_1867320 [marine sediment metagenome]|uniref:Uncharacterized protein n=1 Tax=marine sediment metagenome TaxID=412755 RepID=A0A0F9IK38_9ZZZZ